MGDRFAHDPVLAGMSGTRRLPRGARHAAPVTGRLSPGWVSDGTVAEMPRGVFQGPLRMVRTVAR